MCDEVDTGQFLSECSLVELESLIVDGVRILIGVVGLLFGAETLVRSGSHLARAFGVGPIVVGVTVVAYGTSFPELIVNLQAASNGSPSLAVANVVGSNICTIGIVLGVAGLTRPLRVSSAVSRFHLVTLIVSGICVALALADRTVSRLEGSCLVIFLIIYTIFSVRSARQRGELLGDADAEVLAPVGHDGKSIAKYIGGVAFGIVLLGVGGRLVVEGAVGIARFLEVSERVIGVTLVAFGTSLPDLAASVMAAYRKEFDIAIGNVLGSVIFNNLNALALTAIIFPMKGIDIQVWDLVAMLGFIAIVPIFLKSDARLTRVESAILVVSYMAYLVLSWG